MKCPSCQNNDDRSIDSRPLPDGNRRRRRECSVCGHRWSTVETHAPNPHRQEQTRRMFRRLEQRAELANQR